MKDLQLDWLTPRCGFLQKNSTSQIAFVPFNGAAVQINGIVYPIPSGGVLGSNSGLAASTSYYVYVLQTAGVLSLEFSATAYATSATVGNLGMMIKSGDDTRTLVGIILTDGSSNFFVVRTWFNQDAQPGFPYTPVFTCSSPGDLAVTYAFRQGIFFRRGAQVFAQFDLVLTPFTYTTATGPAGISGCPFLADDDYDGFTEYQGWTPPAGYTILSAATSAGGTGVDFECSGSGKSARTVVITDFPSGGTVLLRTSYWFNTTDP